MKGELFTVEEGYASVATMTHPCVKRTLAAVADQGVLPGGMLYARDADSKVIPYDRAGAAPANALKGVLDKQIDTASDDAAICIVHGTVNGEMLCYGAAGGDVTAADIAALEAISIWPE